MKKSNKLSIRNFLIFVVVASNLFILSQCNYYQETGEDLGHAPAFVISPDDPYDVTTQAKAYPSVNLTELGTFAWKKFVSYNYPANTSKRGSVKSGSNFGDPGPRVWETFWHRNEIFPYNESPGFINSSNQIDRSKKPNYQYEPSAFRFKNNFGANGSNGDSTLWNNLSENNELNVDQLFSHEVTDENRILYEAKMNYEGTDYIIKNNLYKKSVRDGFKSKSSSASSLEHFGAECNVTTDDIVCFPCGGNQGSSNSYGNVEIKAAWKKLNHGEDKSKYHTSQVMRYQVKDNGPRRWYVEEYGLVGLHIISKTINFPSFVYATFEHVDNDQTGAFSMIDEITQNNRGSGDVAGDTIIGITRVNANTPQAIVDLNNEVHTAMGNVVWKNYKLTGVQAYPLDYHDFLSKTQPSNLSSDESTFYLANLAIESNEELQSFRGKKAGDQPDVDNMYSMAAPLNMGGCMGCHGVAQLKGGDFNFLVVNAPFTSPEFVGSDEGIINFRVINNYSDVQKMFNEFVNLNSINIGASPHGKFWETLTYEEFISQSVPNVGSIKICDCSGNKGDESNIITILEGMLGGISEMPAGGPYFPEAQVDEFKKWIDKGCPNGNDNASLIQALTWSKSGPGTTSATKDLTSSVKKFDYSLKGQSVWQKQTWEFSAIAPYTGTLSFDWNYSGFHAWYQAYFNVATFSDLSAGSKNISLINQNNFGRLIKNGTVSIQIEKGKKFGFTIQGKNFDRDDRLIGELTATFK